jgi:hypothetical protein
MPINNTSVIVFVAGTAVVSLSSVVIKQKRKINELNSRISTMEMQMKVRHRTFQRMTEMLSLDDLVELLKNSYQDQLFEDITRDI